VSFVLGIGEMRSLMAIVFAQKDRARDRGKTSG